MKLRRLLPLFQLFQLALMLLAFSGCAQLLGSLRRDLDDGDSYASAGPTTGGRWAERGFLAEDLPEGGSLGSRTVGHSERNPASGSYGSGHRSSWVNPERAEANRRDDQRGFSEEEEGPTSDSNPVMEPNVRRQYKNGPRATRADFLDESQNEGSLWASDGQTNYYFLKNKIRGVGDIISITLESELIRDMGLEMRRTLSEREKDYELKAAQGRLRQNAQGGSPDGKTDTIAGGSAAPSRTPAQANGQSGAPGQATDNGVGMPNATFADVDVSKSLDVKAGDVMMGEIVERYPNGNYKIRAAKKIPYKGGAPRFVNLVGVVKGTDIAEDDTVPSGKLYEYRVEANR